MNDASSFIYPDKEIFNKQEMLVLMEEMINSKYNKKTLQTGRRKFNNFVMHLFNQAAQNYDNMVLLTGQKGTGKSSAGVQMAREWCRIIGRPWDPKKYIAYSSTQLMHLIDTLPPFSPILCDEAINFASSENWNKPANKELKIKLGVIRTKHLFFMLCLPWSITKLDKVYFNSYVNYWIDLHARGVGTIFVKDMNPAGDPWKLKSFQDLGSYNEFTSRELIEKKLQKHPNFWMLCPIPRVPQKIYDAYLLVRESNIYGNETVMESVTQAEATRALMVKALYDITLKGSSFTVGRLKKHFREMYQVDVPLPLINNVFEDARMLTEKVSEAKTINNLKR